MRVVLKAIQRRMQRNSSSKNKNHNSATNNGNNNKSSSDAKSNLLKNKSTKNSNKKRIPESRTVQDKPAKTPQREPPLSVVDYQDLKTLKAVLIANDPSRRNSRNNNNNNKNGAASSSAAGTVGIVSGDNSSIGSTSLVENIDDSSLGDHSGNMDSNSSDVPASSSSFQPVEWTLPLVDEETSEPQTMEEEFQRLQVLQSYFVLDVPGELEFDRITKHAAKVLKTPMATISLIDLGRVWLMSPVGFGAGEVPRKLSFCSHTILNKYKQLIVPDATKDVRFQNNPFVTDPNGLAMRFYAGAALVSPEGYKLGTICLISQEPRPQGLTLDEQEILQDLAAMVVSAMVARRTRLLKEEYEHKFLQLAHTLMDTHANLRKAETCIQTILSRQQQQSSNSIMAYEDASELDVTAKDLALQSQICAAATRSVLQDVPSLRQHPAAKDTFLLDEEGANEDKNDYDDDDEEGEEEEEGYASMPPQIVTTLGDDGIREEENALLFWDDLLQYDKIVNPTTDMQKLYDNLNSLVAQFPHSNIVTLELYKSVPKFLIAEDLLLFRCILNLITHCMGASRWHSCGLRIRNKKTSHGTNANELLIHCLQGGPLVPYVRAKEWFHNPDSLLAPVATMVRTLGGQYGMFQGRWNRPKPAQHKTSNNTAGDDPAAMSPSSSKSKGGKLQSIYWLQIPYELPGEQNDEQEQPDDRFRHTQLKVHRPVEQQQAPPTLSVSSGSSSNVKTTDPFLPESLLDIGCGSNHGMPRAAPVGNDNRANKTTTRVRRSASRVAQ
ncbi:hypothetical protein ACA910_007456 [Epithemia clementina (nom. ined.)]